MAAYKIRAVLLLLLMLCLTGACVNEDEPDYTGIAAGNPLPSFSVTLSDGREVSTASLKGKRVLIEFFNTECPDCRESLPVINQLYNSLKDDIDVEIFAVAREERADRIAPYWEEHGFTLPYSPQPDRKVYNLFANVGIPRIFIAGPDGVVTAIFGPDDTPSLPLLISLLK